MPGKMTLISALVLIGVIVAAIVIANKVQQHLPA